MQFVFAGKAHPADEAGKHHLQNVFRHALDPRIGGRIAFVDDYDLHVAHMLVQGCDVWLNTPRKPLEASGTSGMKASMNGVLHLSIGDGWWAEGYTGTNGWLIDGQTGVAGARRRRRRPTPTRSTSCSRTRSCRRSTSATPAASPPMDRDGQAGDPDGHAALLGPPHAEGVRRARPTRRRSQGTSSPSPAQSL